MWWDRHYKQHLGLNYHLHFNIGGDVKCKGEPEQSGVVHRNNEMALAKFVITFFFL